MEIFFPKSLTSFYENIQYLLPFCICVFWNSFTIHSVRLGNDSFVYIFSILGLYFITRYWLLKKPVLFFYALVFSVLAVYSKSNGILVLLVVFFVFIFETIRDFRSNGFSKNNFINYPKLKALFLSIVCLLPLYFRVKFSKADNVLVSNVGGLPNSVKVLNNISNYVVFDINDYLSVPFTNIYSDYGGRQFFWNFLFKTSLFGEFGYYNSHIESVAIIMSTLFLFLILFFLISIFKLCKQGIFNALPLIFYFIISLGALMYVRFQNPFACSGDFRYILPIVPIFAISIGFSNTIYQE